MKKFTAALLSLLLLLSAAFPVSAVSSGGLGTYYYVSGLRYAKRTGLHYDCCIYGISFKAPGEELEWSKDDHSDVVFSQDCGIVYYGADVTLYGDYDDTTYAAATDFPIIQCWFDDILISDGVNIKKAYDDMSSKWGYPYYQVGTHTIVTMADGYAVQGIPDWTVQPTKLYSFDTRSLTPGKHTVRFAINPDYSKEEMDSSNNEFIRNVIIKGVPAAPAAPTLENMTSVSIAVYTVSGQEYSIDNGATWQTSGLFSGLSPNTMYQIAARVKATAEMPCSDRSAFLNVTTDKLSADAPAAPVLEQKTDTSISIHHIVGAEYSIDGGSSWQTSPRFTGLHPNTGYSVTARYAETGSSYASPASPALSCTTKKGSPSAPSRPVLQGSTDSTITVRAGARS